MQQTWYRWVAVKFSAAARRSPKVGGGAHKLSAAARRAHDSTLKTAFLFVFSVFSFSSPPHAPILLLSSTFYSSPPLLLLSSTFFLLLLFSSFSSVSSPLS